MALRGHLAGGGLRGVEGAAEVGVEGEFPVFGVEAFSSSQQKSF